MKSNLLQMTLVSSLGLSLAACSLKKDAETMRDATKNIETNSKQLTDRTEDLTHDMREVETAHLRKEAKDLIEAAEGDAQRFAGAALFLVGMEFQKWKGNYSDTSGERLNLFKKALTIFFACTKDWINSTHAINISDDPGYFLNDWVSPTFRSIGAMSAELNIIHPEQISYATNAGTTAESMYTLIVKGLRYKAASNRGEVIPAYAAEVLRREPEAIYILQLRHNFLLAKTLGQLTSFSDNYSQKLLMSMSMTSWSVSKTVNLDTMNAERLLELTTQINEAEETKARLREFGHVPKYNGMILKAWSAMEIKASGGSNAVAEPHLQSVKANFLKAHQHSVNEYKSQK